MQSMIVALKMTDVRSGVEPDELSYDNYTNLGHVDTKTTFV